MSEFHLGTRSTERLEQVHPDLQRVIKRAITITTVDFTILEGLRSAERQKELVKHGASKTLDSRHLTGHAVDLGAVVGGQVRWDWPLYYDIASAVVRASFAEGIPVRWGGCWDKMASQLDANDIEAEVSAYVARQKRAGLKAFIDGPHFELPKKDYP